MSFHHDPYQNHPPSHRSPTQSQSTHNHTNYQPPTTHSSSLPNNNQLPHRKSPSGFYNPNLMTNSPQSSLNINTTNQLHGQFSNFHYPTHDLPNIPSNQSPYSTNSWHNQEQLSHSQQPILTTNKNINITNPYQYENDINDNQSSHQQLPPHRLHHNSPHQTPFLPARFRTPSKSKSPIRPINTHNTNNSSSQHYHSQHQQSFYQSDDLPQHQQHNQQYQSPQRFSPTTQQSTSSSPYRPQQPLPPPSSSQQLYQQQQNHYHQQQQKILQQQHNHFLHKQQNDNDITPQSFNPNPIHLVPEPPIQFSSPTPSTSSPHRQHQQHPSNQHQPLSIPQPHTVHLPAKSQHLTSSSPYQTQHQSNNQYPEQLNTNHNNNNHHNPHNNINNYNTNNNNQSLPLHYNQSHLQQQSNQSFTNNNNNNNNITSTSPPFSRINPHHPDYSNNNDENSNNNSSNRIPPRTPSKSPQPSKQSYTFDPNPIYNNPLQHQSNYNNHSNQNLSTSPHLTTTTTQQNSNTSQQSAINRTNQALINKFPNTSNQQQPQPQQQHQSFQNQINSQPILTVISTNILQPNHLLVASNSFQTVISSLQNNNIPLATTSLLTNDQNNDQMDNLNNTTPPRQSFDPNKFTTPPQPQPHQQSSQQQQPKSIPTTTTTTTTTSTKSQDPFLKALLKQTLRPFDNIILNTYYPSTLKPHHSVRRKLYLWVQPSITLDLFRTSLASVILAHTIDDIQTIPVDLQHQLFPNHKPYLQPHLSSTTTTTTTSTSLQQQRFPFAICSCFAQRPKIEFKELRLTSKTIPTPPQPTLLLDTNISYNIFYVDCEMLLSPLFDELSRTNACISSTSNLRRILSFGHYLLHDPIALARALIAAIVSTYQQQQQQQQYQFNNNNPNLNVNIIEPQIQVVIDELIPPRPDSIL